jgi:succinate dehydrogenase / fumarate reductase cytochrome b subunit
MSAALRAKRIPPWRSTIGLKVIMAASGAGLVLFVLQHMVGNLQVFAGPDAFNDYAAFMQSLGGVKWGARILLLVALAMHVASAVALSKRNGAARERAYAGGLATKRTSVHARWMLGSGIVVLAYLAYHIAHFTLGVVHPEHFGAIDSLGRHDVYDNFVLSFQNPVITTLYCVANLALASHLSHAVTSTFRTLGLSQARTKAPFHKVGPAIGATVAVGNLAMPLACLFGILKPVGY